MRNPNLTPLWRVSWVNNGPHHLDTVDPTEATRAAAVLQQNKIKPNIQMAMTSGECFPWDYTWIK
jgi:hypothetical protein